MLIFTFHDFADDNFLLLVLIDFISSRLTSLRVTLTLASSYIHGDCRKTFITRTIARRVATSDAIAAELSPALLPTHSRLSPR